ncbi:MAG TPA: phosphoribulokinase [Pseudonocardiaceae bacterium]|nr:phosphoribulokinase [Pseudonocardiaceae bacterium]
MSTHPVEQNRQSVATRPVILGVVGDSATGKTTLTRGLVRTLGEGAVVHIATDDYHRFDRKRRAELGITPLNPDCNYIDIMAQHLALVRAGEPILKPVYRHADGTFGPPEYMRPHRFAVVEGLLGYHTPQLRDCYDVRVYLAPPENLRRRWKIQRDCSRRGYTTDQVLTELDRREPDSEVFIRPQRTYADIVVTFEASDGGDVEHLPAQLTLRKGLLHPDLSPLLDSDVGITMEDAVDAQVLRIPGHLPAERAAEIEQAIWEWMHFASHLRSERLGEFTVGTNLYRSESLALVQLLLLYHLVMAKATVALGGVGARADGRSTLIGRVGQAAAEDESAPTESEREGVPAPVPAESGESKSEVASE